MFSPIAAAVTIFAWGIATFAIVPPLQMRVMEAASEAPNLASAVNIGAFNLGNAVGAAVGGGVIGLGLGYPLVSIAGAVMAIGGLVIVLVWRKTKVASLLPVGAVYGKET
jgi:DHA1 family inner membrane transport protein